VWVVPTGGVPKRPAVHDRAELTRSYAGVDMRRRQGACRRGGRAGWRGGIRRVAIRLLLLLPWTAGACGWAWAQDASPAGLWRTRSDGAVIEIEACGTALCGRIAGMRFDAPDSPMPTDHQGRPQCGLRIIEMTPQDGRWGGTITDPRDGAVWRAVMWVENGDLHLRGYLLVPLFGQTQVWTRYRGRILPNCRLE